MEIQNSNGARVNKDWCFHLQFLIYKWFSTNDAKFCENHAPRLDTSNTFTFEQNWNFQNTAKLSIHIKLLDAFCVHSSPNLENLKIIYHYQLMPSVKQPNFIFFLNFIKCVMNMNILLKCIQRRVLYAITEWFDIYLFNLLRILLQSSIYAILLKIVILETPPNRRSPVYDPVKIIPGQVVRAFEMHLQRWWLFLTFDCRHKHISLHFFLFNFNTGILA